LESSAGTRGLLITRHPGSVHASSVLEDLKLAIILFMMPNSMYNTLQVYHRYKHTFALRRRRNRGLPSGRAASTRSDMRLKQTAVGTPRYQPARVPTLRRAERGQRRSQSASADVHAAPGPCGRGWTERSSGPVVGSWPSAKTPLGEAEPTPSRFPADRRVAGSHRVNNLRLTQAARAVLHGRCARLATTSGRRPTRTTT